MRIPRLFLTLGALVAAVVACGGDKSVGPKTGDPTTVTLSCAGNNGGSASCTIPIASSSRFQVEVVSTACEAHGNILRVVAPVDSVLTSDACYLAPGSKWDFPGPFGTAASLNMSVTSKYFDFPPSLRVTQTATQEWQIVFEDGYDRDFNDVILKVTASNP